MTKRKTIMLFILGSLFLLISINSPNTESNLESIATDRYVLTNQSSSVLFISTVTVKPNIALRDDNVISKVLDEIKYFIATDTTSSLGSIELLDAENVLWLLVDKENKSIYFEDTKEFATADCDYFIKNLMKYIKWNIK